MIQEGRILVSTHPSTLPPRTFGPHIQATSQQRSNLVLHLITLGKGISSSSPTAIVRNYIAFIGQKPPVGSSNQSLGPIKPKRPSPPERTFPKRQVTRQTRYLTFGSLMSSIARNRTGDFPRSTSQQWSPPPSPLTSSGQI
jgi:hypothetical protein